MSQSADAAIDRWYDIVRGHTKKGPLRASNIVVHGDLLYSYGTHFELARPLRDKKGQITAYLLNGDTYSVTTSSHQSHVRSRLSGEQTVIIPHSALNSAGIDLESVQIVHVKPDTHTTTKHCTTEIPESARWRTEDVREYRPPSEEDYAEALVRATEDARRNHAWRVQYHQRDPGVWQDPGPFEPPTKDDLHLYGKHVKVGETAKLYTSGRGWQEIEVVDMPDGTKEYRWETTRHWLGEALVRARVTWTTSHPCQFCRGGRVYGPRTEEDPWGYCKPCNGHGGTTKAHHRWAYYLSGFDHEEARPLYFFAELPRGAKPATVAEAYEALKPEPVKMAEQMNRPVFRQGDIFGVPLETMDRKTLKALGARVERRKVPPIPEGQTSVQVHLPYVLNTNHTATEVAYLPDGVTLARGTMYHDPEGRRADHARRRIGDGKSWHVVIKNTVPISARR